MSANRIADLTVDEFKALIRETVRETIRDMEQETDAEQETTLNPALANRLRAYLKEKPAGRPAAEVHRELGLATGLEPLDDFIGMLDDDIPDLSSTVRETMEAYYRKKYGIID